MASAADILIECREATPEDANRIFLAVSTEFKSALELAAEELNERKANAEREIEDALRSQYSKLKNSRFLRLRLLWHRVFGK